MLNRKIFDTILYLSIVAILLLGASSYAKGFSWESLRFEVNPEYVHTYGEYHFKDCDTVGETVSLNFHFSTRDSLGKPYDINITTLKGDTINWEWIEEHHEFSFDIPQDPCAVIINYKTNIPSNLFIYPLTKAYDFDESLDSCIIEIRFSEKLSVSSNYSADTVFYENNIAVVKLRKLGFSPEQDFEITINPSVK